MNRRELLEQIERLQNENSEWGQRLATLVSDFETDQIDFSELSEIINDYRRRLQNEQAVAATEARARAEVCLEALFKLAQAVV